MKRFPNTAIAAAVMSCLALTSCHDLTEYEGSMTAGVLFIRTSDFTEAGSIGGIDDGRVIYSVNSTTVYVLSGGGNLYRLDTEAMTVDSVITVFAGPGSGYYDIVAPPPRSKLYVMGNGSQLVEVGTSPFAVNEVFQVGPSPCCITEGNGMIYVGDSQDNRFREVNPTYNIVTRWTQLWFTPLAVEVGNDGDFCMVTDRNSGENGFIRLFTPAMNYSYNEFALSSPGYDIQAVADTSSFFTTCPNWSQGWGNVVVSDSLGEYLGSQSLAGHPFALASTPLGQYLCVLSKTAEGTGMVTVLDIWFGGTVAEIPIDGYPWDITVHGNGEYLLVLMGE